MKILDLEQQTKEWEEARLEKVSGTRLAAALGSPLKREGLINELISERLTGERKEVYQNGAMLLGTEAEPHAADEYEIETGEITEQVGLCISDKYDWLVCSPDRLVRRDGTYVKAVEIKSPNPSTAIRYIRDNEIPKEYEAQIMNYFLVNEDLEELDFVVYSPKIANQYRLWIKNIKREDLDLEKAEKKLLAFREEWLEALRELNLEF
jgi:putative phage-type endonuclease